MVELERYAVTVFPQYPTHKCTVIHGFLLLNRERFTILYQQFQAKSNECIQCVTLRCEREEEERWQRRRLEAE